MGRYANVGDEEEMSQRIREILPEFLQIVHLLSILRDNSPSILEERHHNQEPADSR
jgi:hypothetical protein